MPFVYDSALAWRTLACLMLFSAIASVARGADNSFAASTLALDEALSLAVLAQPQIDGFEAQIRAAQAAGIAAQQLPDPQLKLGLADWPVTTRDAGSFTRDTDTQLQVGISQEFPRAEKRRLRGELLARESDRLRAEEHLTTRRIRRDTALAWLEVWRYERARALARDSVSASTAQSAATEIELRNGSATQTDFLRSRQEIGQLRDREQAAAQQAARARAGLARWIGDAAFRSLPTNPPAVPDLPPLAVVIARATAHPHLAGAAAKVAFANTEAALAQAAYQPDWRVELSYGARPDYSDMVGVQVGIDLPVFPGARQNQSLLAAISERAAAESAHEDATRGLMAEVRARYEDEKYLLQRLAAYDPSLIPDGRARIAAALAGLRAGRNQFRDVLEARRAALETQLSRLDLLTDGLKASVELAYFGAYQPIQNQQATADE